MFQKLIETNFKIYPDLEYLLVMLLKTVGHRIRYPDEDKVEEIKHVFFNESKIGMDSFPNKNDSTSTVTFMPEQVEKYLTIEEKERPVQESTLSIEWKRVAKKREKLLVELMYTIILNLELDLEV
ncbi:hypothetical protein AVEN_143332-1 [Araneus ventricosus]|uniref:Uncharacterized protein n=1 Tax=Araneus ventricosus TaxID=182803 RepID=A0A4Y2AE85_ARAVE|nr:hypothetical protein AVEN_143332-1 [Araneus ventricosus]